MLQGSLILGNLIQLLLPGGGKTGRQDPGGQCGDHGAGLAGGKEVFSASDQVAVPQGGLDDGCPGGRGSDAGGFLQDLPVALLRHIFSYVLHGRQEGSLGEVGRRRGLPIQDLRIPDQGCITLPDIGQTAVFAFS